MVFSLFPVLMINYYKQYEVRSVNYTGPSFKYKEDKWTPIMKGWDQNITDKKKTQSVISFWKVCDQHSISRQDQIYIEGF